MIVIRHEPLPAELSDFRFALFSDHHLGVYNDHHLLERAFKKDNWTERVDFVVIAGDWVYGITEKEIETFYEPFGKLDIPVYAVLGNHDFAPAGELDTQEGQKLMETLQDLGVIFIDNHIENFEKNGKSMQIAGLGELWNDQANIEILKELDPTLPSITIVHNPDAAALIQKNATNLVLAGHTHGGQIRIPFIYKHLIPTELDFDDGQGWFNLNSNPLYITSGLGEMGVPMRLGVPPEIVIFNESL